MTSTRLPNLLEPNIAQSSPSNITATRGSSVWLHWNYTVIDIGLYNHTFHFSVMYQEEVIGENRVSNQNFRVLARKVGKNGTLRLESPLPAPFNGRIEVISSNSTLVIHDLRYNDSAFQFSSNVTLDIDLGAGPKSHIFRLKPIVSITVIGMQIDPLLIPSISATKYNQLLPVC